jgi:peptidoglycan-N-acetylglucosamine deacetylase
MRVTLTFDNGPSPGTTSTVLDVLAARDVRATFFVVGTMLAKPGGRSLAERARGDGHWIGNHSMTHAVALGDDPDRDNVIREIDDAQALLGDLAHERRLFRPFGRGGLVGPHLLNEAAVAHLCAGGYTCVLWTSVPRDWEDPTGWVDTALADVDETDHSVVVLHDLPTGAMQALPAFLDQLERRGAEIVQDFPPEVIVIDQGSPRALDGLVSA